jgi:two-component system CheB/CheR fusion protein
VAKRTIDGRNGKAEPAGEVRPAIIGIGASAAAPESLDQFFSGAAALGESACVLVLQHREIAADAPLVERIRLASHGTVVEAKHGVQLEAGKIFVIPPNVTATLKKGELRFKSAHWRYSLLS